MNRLSYPILGLVVAVIALGCQPSTPPTPVAGADSDATPKERSSAPTGVSEIVDADASSDDPNRNLPAPPAAGQTNPGATAVDLPKNVATTEGADTTEAVVEPEPYVSPASVAASAFEPPPGAKPLSKQNLWIDTKSQRVIFDGYVALREGPLEMFACPVGTKEHESIIAAIPKSSQVHAALLAVGAKSGTPVTFHPQFLPPTGGRVRVWITYRDANGDFQVDDGRRWVRSIGTDDSLADDWVFAGSGFWTDPSDGREYYRGDAGDMICVSNFSSAMLDVPVASSADADDLRYEPYTDRIPAETTPVRLVLQPIPLGDEDVSPPTELVLGSDDAEEAGDAAAGT